MTSPFVSDYNEPKGRYFASEDLDFQAGDSPAVLDIVGTLGVPTIDGRLVPKSNSGNTGDVLVELSFDGSTYGNQFTVFHLETFSLFGFKIKKIRITHTGTDSGYRVWAR